jgi:hypothetical protein
MTNFYPTLKKFPHFVETPENQGYGGRHDGRHQEIFKSEH